MRLCHAPAKEKNHACRKSTHSNFDKMTAFPARKV
jgi:hypothetical protein